MKLYIRPESIRNARVSAFKTQQQLADESGVGLSTLERIEHAGEVVGVRHKTLVKLCKALGVKMEDILERVEA